METIAQKPLHGGQACPALAEEWQPCNFTACPVPTLPETTPEPRLLTELWQLRCPYAVPSTTAGA